MVNAAYHREWRKKNAEKVREAQQRYRIKNRARVLEGRRIYNQKHKARLYVQRQALRQASIEHYRSKERDVGRRRAGLPVPTRPEPTACECCGKPGRNSLRRESPQALGIDHDHVTGAFRGWLCAPCNRGIGSLGDAADGVLNALKYLQKARGH